MRPGSTASGGKRPASSCTHRSHGMDRLERGPAGGRKGGREGGREGGRRNAPPAAAAAAAADLLNLRSDDGVGDAGASSERSVVGTAPSFLLIVFSPAPLPATYATGRRRRCCFSVGAAVLRQLGGRAGLRLKRGRRQAAKVPTHIS